MAVLFSFLFAKTKRIPVSFIRCQLQSLLPLQNSGRLVLMRTDLFYQMTGVKMEAKIYVATLTACVMINPASLSPAIRGKSYPCARVQVDPISIFFAVSSAHGKEKPQRLERQGREARPLIPDCAGPARSQWNYTPIRHKEHKPEPAPRCALSSVYCVYAKTL